MLDVSATYFACIELCNFFYSFSEIKIACSLCSHNLLEAEQLQFSVQSGRQCVVSALPKGEQHTIYIIYKP